jgi:hypothetical protein
MKVLEIIDRPKQLIRNSAILGIDIETYQNLPMLNEFVREGIKPDKIYWKIIKKPDDPSVIVYEHSDITIESSGMTKTFHNAKGFTQQDLLDLILEMEQETRPKSEFCGGVDVHHIYLDALNRDDNGNYSVFWGS